ncbi:hypothetical protein BH10ACI1_BH10ACI1_16480 [soil metagenome]
MYPETDEEFLEALTLQETHIDQYKSDVGASDEDIRENNQDRANTAASMANQVLADAIKLAATQIKNAVRNGSPLDPVSAYPADTIAALPFPTVPAGAETRYNERRRRYKSAKGYTKEIGIALGLEKPAQARIQSELLTAAATLKDLGNYQAQGEFKKQGMNGMAFQWRVKGTEKWSNAINALQSPVVFGITEPATEGAAVQIEVRCRLLQGNTQVGNWSPIYLLTITS